MGAQGGVGKRRRGGHYAQPCSPYAMKPQHFAVGFASYTQRYWFRDTRDRSPTGKDGGRLLLQLMTGEGAEDLRVADDEAYVVQGGIAGVMHDHAASV